MHPLDNIIWKSISQDKNNLSIKYNTTGMYLPSVAPFVGMEKICTDGWQEVSSNVDSGRIIILFTKEDLSIPDDYELLSCANLDQMVYDSNKIPVVEKEALIKSLNQDHVEDMIALTHLTKPGPFLKDTIKFGNYKGIFYDGKLVSMSGFRMQVDHYREISAVCTDPNHLGNGYASLLLNSLIRDILDQNEIPILHVRSDNQRAIEVYQKIGFQLRRTENFYVLRKK